MTAIALTIMIGAIVIIWGGLVASVVALARRGGDDAALPSPVKHLVGPSRDAGAGDVGDAGPAGSDDPVAGPVGGRREAVMTPRGPSA